MNFLVNQRAKATGRAIGGSAFNSGVTSCDMNDKNGNRCCSDSKEAQQKNLPYCAPLGGGNSTQQKKK